MTLLKSSFVSRHILAKSTLFVLLVSEIMGPNLVLTTTHCSDVRRYLRMVEGLSLTVNLRVTKSIQEIAIAGHFGRVPGRLKFYEELAVTSCGWNWRREQ